MFILSNFISAVTHVLDVLLSIISWLVIIRALISWVNPDPANAIVQFLYKTTDYYAPEHERCVIWNDSRLAIQWPLVETRF